MLEFGGCGRRSERYAGGPRCQAHVLASGQRQRALRHHRWVAGTGLVAITLVLSPANENGPSPSSFRTWPPPPRGEPGAPAWRRKEADFASYSAASNRPPLSTSRWRGPGPGPPGDAGRCCGDERRVVRSRSVAAMVRGKRRTGARPIMWSDDEGMNPNSHAGAPRRVPPSMAPWTSRLVQEGERSHGAEAYRPPPSAPPPPFPAAGVPRCAARGGAPMSPRSEHGESSTDDDCMAPSILMFLLFEVSEGRYGANLLDQPIPAPTSTRPRIGSRAGLPGRPGPRAGLWTCRAS